MCRQLPGCTPTSFLDIADLATKFHHMNSNPTIQKSILFITYDGLLDPLGYSQVLPYIRGIHGTKNAISILSFEKTSRDPSEISILDLELSRAGITWFRLSFLHGRFQGIKRILRSVCLIRSIAKSRHFDLIHLRAIIPALILLLSRLNVSYIYDIRAFSGQWVDSGRLKRHSFAHILLQLLERSIIKHATGIVVLDESARTYLLNHYQTSAVVSVIPTSVAPYPLSRPSSTRAFPKTLRFLFLGGARHPYLPSKALDLIYSFVRLSYNVSLDFINDNDHDYILKLCEQSQVPLHLINITRVNPSNIPLELPKYDCGICFLSEGPWINMSSPTKIGEYLMAGLHVVGLSHTQILQRLANSSHSTTTFHLDADLSSLSPHTVRDLYSSITDPRSQEDARKIASTYYSRQAAINQYRQLYASILPDP